MNTSRFALSALVIAAPFVALAGPTGLASIPIADILGHREALYAYAAAGTESHVDKKIAHAHGLTVGLFDRVELGFDNDFAGGTNYNAKLLLAEDPRNASWALSVGVLGFEDGKGSPYLVGRKDFKGFRAHGGVLRDGEDRLILGFDGLAFGDCVWMLDHTTGSGSMTWAALDVPVKPVDGMSVTFSLGIPQKRSDGVQGSVTLNFGTKF